MRLPRPPGTQPHDPITLRYVAAMFEAVGVDRVIVLEVHNEAAFDNAFRCPTVRLDADGIFMEELVRRCDAQQLIIVSPDVGGVKRAQRLQQRFA